MVYACKFGFVISNTNILLSKRNIYKFETINQKFKNLNFL